MLETPRDMLAALHDPLLDGMFHRASRVGVESAWYGHVPFGYWIVGQIRPRVLVELGTHNGVSYASFCDAVVDARLATRCFAVDTWEGDPHAGNYGEEVLTSLRQFHDARYGGFSRLLRMTFDTAVGQMPDASIDLLHIDGHHTYEAVRHDFDSWRPKLSDQAVVLFHDTNVREREFGVWRLWQELRARYPGFEFLHAHGLGVLAVGTDASPAVAALCALTDDRAIAAVRDRFAVLGERWHTEAVLQLHEAQMAERHAALVAQKDADAIRAQRQIAGLRQQLVELRQQHNNATAAITHLRGEISLLRAERAVILGSTSWRATAPLRAAIRGVPAPLRRVAGLLRHPQRLLSRPAQAVPADPAPPTETPAAAGSIVFVSGEAHTPGHHYRVLRAVAAATACGMQASWFPIAEAAAHLADVARAQAVVIWRAPWSDALAEVIRVAREANARIVYDVDDLMFVPDLAKVEIIDGIRSQNFDEQAVAAMFENVLRALMAADLCTCPTTEIALRIRAYQKPAMVLPNGFDAALQQRSRLAVRQWQAEREPGIVRVGYAAGSRTHQRDFAVAANAVARVLRERPRCRLVLFRSETEPLIDVEEFPALAAVEHQIEWRWLRPLAELPEELARFDVNLAPLEVGNPFCEAKSELKFFEAALVDVCTIASPTGPFQRCIRDGETGFLAATDEDWYRRLLTLVDDTALRRKVGHAAYLDVLWTYGPQRRAELVAVLLRQLRGGADAAQAAELLFLRERARSRAAPCIPAADIVFQQDQLGEAEVTVVMPVHNYAHYVVEALDSVRAQSLQALDLIAVDDASTDDSLAVLETWMRANAERFNRVTLLKNQTNAGLSLTRNVAIDAAETAFVLPLDADNRLLPDCCAVCLEALRESHAAFAYPRIQCFGESTEVIGATPFQPMRLAGGNYIDAMAMVAKWAWAAVGGYTDLRHGWEDYDFWCALVEHGSWGVAVPQILAEYRVHKASMLHTATDIAENKRALIRELQQRHAWLAIPYQE